MSILPPLNQGSTSSSGSSNSRSSSSDNHGVVCAYSQNLHQFSETPRTSGQTAPNAHGSDGSSRKVKGKESLDNGKITIAQIGGEAQISSPEFRSLGWQEKTSGNVTSGHSGPFSSSPTSSGQSTGKKPHMVSGNHLLNFQYDPVPLHRRTPKAQPPRRQKKSKPYNKDLFFQANYKFVMLDTGDDAAASMDPDKMLSWEDIVCLKYTTPYLIQCPICLDDLLCPQITSCGHIFCFPCILQYFSVGEDGLKDECWKKCPLCFTVISSRDLYTIQVENVNHYHVGDQIEFVLLTRPKDSLKSFLKNNESTNAAKEVLDSFSKFTLTSDVELFVRDAMSDLDSWIAKADSGLVDDIERLPYVYAASEQLMRRKRYWVERCNSSRRKADTCVNGSPSAINSPNVNNVSMWPGKLSPEMIVGDICSSQASEASDREISPSSSFDESKYLQTLSHEIKEWKDGDSYTFYQAVDGQHIILHSLNMKCLLHHYGSYDRLPHRITGKILQLETVTQTEAMRRRYRFLSHLSLTTTFQLCEINLGNLLPPESLSPFMDEIKNRERQRKRLARKETREKLKAEALSSEFGPVPYYSHHASQSSPSFSVDDFEALGNPPPPSVSPPKSVGKKSFSNVARLGFAAAHDSPSLKSETVGSSPQPPDSCNITGQRNSGVSFASITSRPKPSGAIEVPEAARKGKKSTRVLLSTAGGRRY